MYTHLAIFKWRPGTTQAEIAAVLKEVEALQAKIPGIIEISTGENMSRYSEGYTHVILVRGESKEAIDAYRKHPDHVIVAEKITAMEEQGIGVDLKQNRAPMNSEST